MIRNSKLVVFYRANAIFHEFLWDFKISEAFLDSQVCESTIFFVHVTFLQILSATLPPARNKIFYPTLLAALHCKWKTCAVKSRAQLQLTGTFTIFEISQLVFTVMEYQNENPHEKILSELNDLITQTKLLVEKLINFRSKRTLNFIDNFLF